jgi:hypothetical protein
MKIGLPVRSAVLKHCAVRLVVGWVTTSESLMLIVFVDLFGTCYIRLKHALFSLLKLVVSCARHRQEESSEFYYIRNRVFP